MNRVAIFIDGAYLDKVLKLEFGGPEIDYGRFAREILAEIHPDADILRTYYYHCLPYQSDPPTEGESAMFASKQKLFDTLERLPRFMVKCGRLVRRGPDSEGRYSYEQKMVDVLLSIDLVLLSVKGQITDAAIVTGDKDFKPAVDIAKSEGVSVWLFHGRRKAHDLWNAADERRKITRSLVNKILS